MVLLIVYLLIALFTSFICSLMEAVLLSTPVTFIKINENSKSVGVRKLINARNNVDRSLSAILSLNTIAHTVGAAGVGAQAVVVFGDAYFGIVSALLTLLILVFTEIIPKTFGTYYWRSLTSFVGHSLKITVIFMYPIVVLSSVLTKLISRGATEETTSREEIAALTEIGTTQGVFHDKENLIIQNLIRLRGVRVSEISTPRTVVSMADQNMTLVEFMNNKDYLKFSRIPVYDGDQDNITGYVMRQNVFEKLAENQRDLCLHHIRKHMVVIPDVKPVLSVWEMLLERKEHIAMIVDEYGGFDGIVTMEDIIETLVGFEIVDEKDSIVDMQQYARERWKQRQDKYRLLESDPGSS